LEIQPTRHDHAVKQDLIRRAVCVQSANARKPPEPGLVKASRAKVELQEKISDLQKFEEVVVGREIRMMQLEKENVELKQRLAQMGEALV
jgi:hypothetical protein